MEGVSIDALGMSSGSCDHGDSGRAQRGHCACIFGTTCALGPYDRVQLCLDAIPVIPCQRQTAPPVEWLSEQSLVYQTRSHHLKDIPDFMDETLS
jgi:hypothetical protein